MGLKTSYREDGFSLLSVVVAIGLAGILMMVINTSLNQQRKVMKQIKYQGEREELRVDLKNRVYCVGASCEQVKKTLPPKLGSWKIRGACDQEGLNIEVRRFNRFGKPSRHPLKNQEMEWENLYNTNDGYLCKFDYSKSLDKASEVDNRREFEDYQQSSDSNRRPQRSNRNNNQLKKILKQDIQNLDERQLKQAVDRAKKMLQTMCPKGKHLVGIDAETMQVMCK